MGNLCIKMSKITKLEIHQKSMNASKPDCPMKSESSGIVTTVAHFGCWCKTYCKFGQLEMMFCLLYICESILSLSIVRKLTQAFYCFLHEGEMKDRKTGWKEYLIQHTQIYKQYIRVHRPCQDFLCIHNSLNGFFQRRNLKVQSSSPLKSYSHLFIQCFPVLNGLSKGNAGTKKEKNNVERVSKTAQKITTPQAKLQQKPEWLEMGSFK